MRAFQTKSKKKTKRYSRGRKTKTPDSEILLILWIMQKNKIQESIKYKLNSVKHIVSQIRNKKLKPLKRVSCCGFRTCDIVVVVEKILINFYLYLILISIMDEGSTIKVI